MHKLVSPAAVEAATEGATPRGAESKSSGQKQQRWISRNRDMTSNKSSSRSQARISGYTNRGSSSSSSSTREEQEQERGSSRRGEKERDREGKREASSRSGKKGAAAAR